MENMSKAGTGRFLKAPLAAAACVATLMLAAAPVGAVPVASIAGQYVGDTPHLWINNTSALSFTNVTLTAYAYNGSNALLAAGTQVDKFTGDGIWKRTQTRTLPTIGAGASFEYVFSDNGQVCGPNGFTGDYFVGDYDDSYGCSAAARPGNLLFTFSATWNGQSIFSQFSPDSNATGGFVGFLGLDQNGFAETSFDNGGAASGVGQFGVLANIFVGAAPDPSGGGRVPEPATLVLVGLALAGAGLGKRRAR